jgi:hypothetical protein
MLNIVVRTLDGQEFELEAAWEATIEHVENVICDHLGIDTDRTRISLSLGPSTLENHKSCLATLGIEDGAVLSVIKREKLQVLTAGDITSVLELQWWW